MKEQFLDQVGSLNFIRKPLPHAVMWYTNKALRFLCALQNPTSVDIALSCKAVMWICQTTKPFSSELRLGVWEFLCSNTLLYFSGIMKFTERCSSFWWQMSLKTCFISNEILVWGENPHNIDPRMSLTVSEKYVGRLDIGPAHISHIRSRTLHRPFPV